MYKTTIGVDGMMCSKCENHVNEMIMRTFSVEKVSSSHADKQTVITSREPVDKEKIREVIENMGYDFISFSVETYEKKKVHIFRK